MGSLARPPHRHVVTAIAGMIEQDLSHPHEMETFYIGRYLEHI